VPYEEFATSFTTRSVDDLHKSAQNHSVKFIDDGNMGLVKQAIQALVEQNIQRLTKTYLTLSLADIAGKVGLQGVAEVEKRVLKMIGSEKVFARINQQDGMVAFDTNPDHFDTQSTLKYLEKQLNKTMTLNRNVDVTDVDMLLSVRYQGKVSLIC